MQCLHVYKIVLSENSHFSTEIILFINKSELKLGFEKYFVQFLKYSMLHARESSNRNMSFPNFQESFVETRAKLEQDIFLQNFMPE